MELQRKTSDIQEAERLSVAYENSRWQRLIDPIQGATLDLVKMMSPKIILDVGCGTGRFLRKLHECWPDASLIGVDPSEGMVREARRLTPGVTFHVAMAESLPLPDASVDLILSTLSFHHWSEPGKGVREIARVLCPKGHVAITDVVLPYGLSILIWHFNQSKPNKIRKMFIEEGLDIQTQQRKMKRFLGITIGIKST